MSGTNAMVQPMGKTGPTLHYTLRSVRSHPFSLRRCSANAVASRYKSPSTYMLLRRDAYFRDCSFNTPSLLTSLSELTSHTVDEEHTGQDTKSRPLMALISPLIAALLVGAATLVGTFVVKLYQARMLLISRRRQGLVR